MGWISLNWNLNPCQQNLNLSSGLLTKALSMYSMLWVFEVSALVMDYQSCFVLEGFSQSIEKPVLCQDSNPWKTELEVGRLPPSYATRVPTFYETKPDQTPSSRASLRLNEPEKGFSMRPKQNKPKRQPLSRSNIFFRNKTSTSPFLAETHSTDGSDLFFSVLTWHRALRLYVKQHTHFGFFRP